MSDSPLVTARTGVMAALVQGDHGLAYRLVSDLFAEGYPFADVLEEVLAPIQAESGRRWFLGDHSIAEEHAATAAAETLVATLAGAFDQPAEGPRYVVATVGADPHSLPARMVAALLLAEGHRVAFLGGSVPVDDLADHLAADPPDALVLSSTLPAHLAGTRDAVAAAHALGVPVIGGGAALGPEGRRAEAMGLDAYAATLRQVALLVETWSPDPAAAEATAVPVPDAVRELTRHRSTIAARTADAVVERAGAAPSDALRRLLTTELAELADAAGVAAWLEEPELLAEHATWLAELLATRSLADPPLTGPDLVAVLVDALAPDHGEVARAVALVATRA